MCFWKWAAVTAAATFLPRYNRTSSGAEFDTLLFELHHKCLPFSRDCSDADLAAFE